MTQQQALDHVLAAEQLWLRRSERAWELDLSILTHAGLTLARPDRWQSR